MFKIFVAGTPYEMGFAHGTLLKEEATDLLNSVWKYLEEQVVIENTTRSWGKCGSVLQVLLKRHITLNPGLFQLTRISQIPRIHNVTVYILIDNRYLPPLFKKIQIKNKIKLLPSFDTDNVRYDIIGRLRSPVRQVFSCGIRYSIFSLWFTEVWVTVY